MDIGAMNSEDKLWCTGGTACYLKKVIQEIKPEKKLLLIYCFLFLEINLCRSLYLFYVFYSKNKDN